MHNSRSGTSIAGTIAPGTPTPASAGAIAFDGTSVSNMLQSAQQQQAVAYPNRPGVGIREADGGWCLSWCKERYWGEVLAGGCGVSGVVKVGDASKIAVARWMLSFVSTFAACVLVVC